MDFDIVCVVLFCVVEFVVGSWISICEFRCWFGLRVVLCSDFDYDLDSGLEFVFLGFDCELDSELVLFIGDLGC